MIPINTQSIFSLKTVRKIIENKFSIIKIIYRLSQNFAHKLGREVEKIVRNHNYIGKYWWKRHSRLSTLSQTSLAMESKFLIQKWHHNYIFSFIANIAFSYLQKHLFVIFSVTHFNILKTDVLCPRKQRYSKSTMKKQFKKLYYTENITMFDLQSSRVVWNCFDWHRIMDTYETSIIKIF